MSMCSSEKNRYDKVPLPSLQRFAVRIIWFSRTVNMRFPFGGWWFWGNKKGRSGCEPGGLCGAIDVSYIRAFKTRRVVRLCECFTAIGAFAAVAVNQFA
jgi:hypothetical protein